ncbi:protein ycf2 [Phtheirospermum japonicum]|uniref:Protein ycf2 n=1 Tax=Phtheirospermum japonicum TaxID=374723 RepID=A0A830BFA6_9LAMI|nr:protein ycf2 [Phtheirospermum japonicum]
MSSGTSISCLVLDGSTLQELRIIFLKLILFIINDTLASKCRGPIVVYDYEMESGSILHVLSDRCFVFSVIHGNDAFESARKEIALWFPEGFAEWNIITTAVAKVVDCQFGCRHCYALRADFGHEPACGLERHTPRFHRPPPLRLETLGQQAARHDGYLPHPIQLSRAAIWLAGSSSQLSLLPSSSAAAEISIPGEQCSEAAVSAVDPPHHTAVSTKNLQ